MTLSLPGIALTTRIVLESQNSLGASVAIAPSSLPAALSTAIVSVTG